MPLRASVYLFAVCLLTSSLGCKGSGSTSGNPNAPTSRVPTLRLAPFTASLTQTASENRYAVRLSVQETGGQAGATLGALELTFTDSAGNRGVSTPADVWPVARLGAGSTVAARAITVADGDADRTNYVRLTARVTYTDDAQASGTVTETIDIQQPAGPPPQSSFTIAGVVSDDPDGNPLAGATVSVVDGANAGRSSTTDGNGYYSIPALRTGSFTIRATKAGYSPADKGLTLSADTRVDLRMRSTAPPSPEPPPSNSNTCSSAPTTAPCGRPTARCNDGTYSCSQNRSGTCSTHKGVSCWICPGALCQGLSGPQFTDRGAASAW